MIGSEHMFLCRNIENYILIILSPLFLFIWSRVVKFASKASGEDLLKAISCDCQMAYGHLCMDFKIFWHIGSSGRLKVKVTHEGQMTKWS